MSIMSSKRKDNKTAIMVPVDDGSPTGTPVDFIFKTMIERASAPGKRQIRPKNVEDLMHAELQEDGSDEDPDFDVSKDKHHNESDVSIGSDDDEDKSGGEESGDDDKASMDGNVEDTDDEDDLSYDGGDLNSDDSDGSNDDSDKGSSGDDSEDSDEEAQSPVQKRSALRDTLQKLKETEEYTPQLKRKRKRPKKPISTSSKVKEEKDDTPSGGKKKGTGKPRPRSNRASAEDKKKTKSSPKKKNKEESEKRRVKKRKIDLSEVKKKSIMGLVSTSENVQKENRKEVNLSQLICSACLGKSSDETNEIVECDSCGITVHEACYGVSDVLSISTGSSASTEPWFCDACRSGAKSISCELCPIEGGLFKETTAGRWVHLVCALYTPGVRINDSATPDLFEIPYAKWGAHTCSLCSDHRFSRSGICIQCDAGMCKSYLHATCAQKHGLLSDPVVHHNDTMEADPYYAACKLHTNRETAKRRSKCYALLQEQLRIKSSRKQSKALTEEEKTAKERILRKLEQIRFKIAIKQAHNTVTVPSKPTPPPAPLTSSNLNELNSTFRSTTGAAGGISGTPVPLSWKEGNKKPRLLTTSAGTAISFYRKASLMGLDIPALELEDKYIRIVGSVKKKWNIPPGLSVEYAAYYGNRETRLKSLTDQYEQQLKENQELSKKQGDVYENYDRQGIHTLLMDEDTNQKRQELKGLTTALKSLCDPTLHQKQLKAVKDIEKKAEIQGSGQRRRSPSHAATNKGRGSSPTKGGGASSSKKPKGSMSPIAGRLAIKTCSVCSGSEDQHLVECCDRCKLYYHLKCLDPPLTRMPKRTKSCGWMCSDCNEQLEAAEAEVETGHNTSVNANAPRTLRGRQKIRKPGKYRHSTDSREGDLKIVELIPTTPTTTTDPVNLSISTPNISISSTNTTPMAIATLNGAVKKVKKQKVKSTTPTPLTTPDISNSDNADSPPKPKRKYTRKKKSTEGSEEGSNSQQQDGNNTTGVKAKKKRIVKKETVLNGDVMSGDEKGILLHPSDTEMDSHQNLLKIPQIKIDGPSEESSTPMPGPSKKKKLKSPKKEKATEGQNLDETPLAAESGSGTPTLGGEGTKPKKPPRKKKKIIKQEGGGEGSGASGLPEEGEGNEASSSSAPKKRSKSPKKPRRSIADLQRSMMAAATVAVKKSEDPNNLNLNIVPMILSNGKPKVAKKRKTSIDTGKPPGEKVMPPKKRKRASTSIPSTATSASTSAPRIDDDVINAVASGGSTADVGANQKNGMGLDAGVLMQGSGWNGNANENGQQIMKGQAMDINSSSSELVTVNASDLLDCVVHTPTTTTVLVPPATGAGYSPGFYSTAKPSTSTNDLDDFFSSSSSIKQSNNGSGPSMVDGEKNPNGSRWGQGQGQQQSGQAQDDNVIKLIYQGQPEQTFVRTTTAPTASPVRNPPTTTTPSATSTSISTNASGSDKPENKDSSATTREGLATYTNSLPNYKPLDQSYGACSTCRKDELKKNMVTCDKCSQDYHFGCLNPPLTYSPRRRNFAWYCSTCDDDQSKQSESETSSTSVQQEVSEDQQPLNNSSVRVSIYNDDNMKNLMKRFCQ